ncbi:MAG: alpha/beta hydrolase [Pirellulaceae bacterium]
MFHQSLLLSCLVAAGVFCLASPGAAEDVSREPEELREPIRLWPEEAPGALGEEDADIPTLTPFLAEPEKATGAAVILCAGGGYSHLDELHGWPFAEWLNSIGVAGFVLDYRVAPYRHPAPLQDTTRAIRTVRAKAAEWGLDPERIGILGLSAGGHAASMSAVHFDAGDPDAEDPIERVSSRPDVLVLSVPVITMRPPHAHAGSVRNLLGEDPDPELVEFCSTDEQVTAETPPTFIVHPWEDQSVPVENSLMFAAGLREAGVPACELHIYGQGAHQFRAAEGATRRVLNTWWDHLADWLRLHDFACPDSEAGPTDLDRF